MVQSLREELRELAQTKRGLEEHIAYCTRRDDAIMVELRTVHERSVRLTEWAHVHGGEDISFPPPPNIPPSYGDDIPLTDL